MSFSICTIISKPLLYYWSSSLSYLHHIYDFYDINHFITLMINYGTVWSDPIRSITPNRSGVTLISLMMNNTEIIVNIFLHGTCFCSIMAVSYHNDEDLVSTHAVVSLGSWMGPSPEWTLITVHQLESVVCSGFTNFSVSGRESTTRFKNNN